MSTMKISSGRGFLPEQSLFPLQGIDPELVNHKGLQFFFQVAERINSFSRSARYTPVLRRSGIS